MEEIKNEKIKGYRIGEEIACLDCATAEEKVESTLYDLILASDIEKSDDQWFCDRCNKEL